MTDSPYPVGRYRSAEEHHAAIDEWLDGLDPGTVTWRDASNIRRIIAARETLEAAQRNLDEAVGLARAAGDSWTMIALGLEVSRQSAWEKYGKRGKLSPGPDRPS